MSKTTLDTRLQTTGRGDIAEANLESFQQAKVTYGNRYDKFLTVYQSIADTLTPDEFNSLVEETHTNHARSRFVDEEDWLVDLVGGTVRNLNRFRQSKRFAYGDNYEPFFAVYQKIADTLNPDEFDRIIKDTYKRHEIEAVRHVAGLPSHKPHTFQKRMLAEIELSATRTRNRKRTEKGYTPAKSFSTWKEAKRRPEPKLQEIRPHRRRRTTNPVVHEQYAVMMKQTL